MPRSIRSRLALGFFAVALAAIAVVFLYVAPTLESHLRAAKIAALSDAADAYSGPLLEAIGSNVDEGEVDREVRQVADRANARVTLLGLSRGTLGPRTYVISDSTTQVDISDLDFALALDAARVRRTVTGAESGDAGRMAQAAKPLLYNGRVARVVVLSAPLRDVAENVAVVRRQILLAGIPALLVALVAGLLVAGALSRRIRRLERAAERVAAGDFSGHFVVDKPDELGSLALALDDMQRQLAQLDSARKRFIATASHELRTPIFSLAGFVELLIDEDLDDETRTAFLVQVRDQTERLRALTVELLDLSRLEAGSLELRPEPTDLGVLAEAVAAEFLPALATRESHLELRLPPEPVQTVCDPDRVAQVLRILVDNALTHTPAGTPIVVAAGRHDGHVSLAVRDSGLGIHRDAVDRIFEPFYTSDDAQGSGLGLAIARELAERMDGELTVESRPGATTFSFELPA